MPSKSRSEVVKQSQKEYFAKNKDRFREMNNASARESMRKKAVFKKMCLMYDRLNDLTDRSNFVETRGRPKKVKVVSFQFV
jgi:hypothetical protein